MEGHYHEQTQQGHSQVCNQNVSNHGDTPTMCNNNFMSPHPQSMSNSTFYNPSRTHEYVNYLNSVSSRKSNNNKKLKDLVVDRYYPVRTFRTVNTKYGKTCVITLYVERDPTQTTFDVFLPKRYSDIYSNSTVRNVYMIYKGKESCGYDYEAHKIVFWTNVYGQ